MRWSGWGSDVFLLADDGVLKIPITDNGRSKLRKEIDVLRSLVGFPKNLVEIPRIHDVRYSDEGVLWVKLSSIFGRTVSRRLVERNATVAGLVGRFIAALHRWNPVGVSLDCMDRMALADYVDQYWHAREEMDGYAALIESALFQVRRLAMESVWPKPMFLHGDLGAKHLRLCESGRLGVFDFGEARLGDPAMDLAWLVGEDCLAYDRVARAAGGLYSGYLPRAVGWSIFYALELARGAGSSAERAKAVRTLRERLKIASYT